MSFRNDERGLAVGLASAFAMLVVAALLYILLFDGAALDVISMTGEQAETTEAGNQIALAESIVNNLLYVPLLIFALFLIVRALREGSVQ